MQRASWEEGGSPHVAGCGGLGRMWRGWALALIDSVPQNKVSSKLSVWTRHADQREGQLACIF
jgi:hypothetical protein